MLLRDIFRSTLSTFQQARRTLNDNRINSPRLITEAFLSSKLSNLKALTEVDQVQKSKADVAVTTLESAGDDLDQLAQLAAAAVNETDPGQRAILQSQAEVILGSVRKSLNTAINNDPGLVNRVLLSSDGYVKSVQVLSQDQNIDADGLTFDFAVSNIGARARIGGAIRTDAGGGTNVNGQIDNNISFQIQGDRGTGTVNLLVGDTVTDIINKVNALTSQTGVIANVGSDVDQVDLLSELPGATAISITELSTDPFNEMIGGSSAVGVDPTGVLTLNGVSTTLTSDDGETFSFDLGGISGVIKLADPAVYLPALGTTTTGNDVVGDGASTSQFIIHNGGRAILGSNGELLGRVGISAFNYDSLAEDEGGLDSIDLVNNASAAASVIAAAHLDIGNGLATAAFIADGLLGERIARNSREIGTAAQAQTELESVYEALNLYAKITAEAQLNSSMALLSQLSQIYPVSTFGLL